MLLMVAIMRFPVRSNVTGIGTLGFRRDSNSEDEDATGTADDVGDDAENVNDDDEEARDNAADDDDDNNWEVGGSRENDIPEP